MIKKIKIFLIFLTITNNLCSIDNPHFYRASHFYGEPRLKKNYLSTLELWGGAGGTCKGLNCHGRPTNILNIYGNDDLKQLARGVSEKILDKSPGSIIDDLWTKHTGEDFGQLRFHGKFNTWEIAINLEQNLMYGFFGQLYMPFRKLKISDIGFDDLTTMQNSGEVNFFEFQKFVTHLRSNLREFGINFDRHFEHTGIGDISLLGGWTCNWQETEYLDFIDTTIQLGGLFPTGRRTDVDNVFDLPQGYNGFYAVGVNFDIAAGLYDWLTVGFYTTALIFVNKIKEVRLKTAKQQSGFIKLSKGFAKVHQGSIVSLGFFLKADHVYDGLCLYFAYRFDKQNRTTLTPCNFKQFEKSIVNQDPMLAGWNMHTISFIFEYDFATIECPNLPRISAFFNIPVGGELIFKTTMSGMGIGFDYAW